MNINDLKNKLIKRYPYSNKLKYISSTPINPRSRLNKITVYYLVYSEGLGYTLMTINYNKKEKPNIKGWAGWLIDKSDTGGYFVFTERILTAHNIRTEKDFALKDILAWRKADDISKPANTSKHKKHKTVKKGRS